MSENEAISVVVVLHSDHNAGQEQLFTHRFLPTFLALHVTVYTRVRAVGPAVQVIQCAHYQVD